MIPEHMIDAAARALRAAELGYYERGDYDDLSPDARSVYREYATAMLAATSKRIWDSGYEAGADDVFYRVFGHKPTPNPYRSSNP